MQDPRLRLLTWNVKAHSAHQIAAAVGEAMPNAVAIQECTGKTSLWPWMLGLSTQERCASAALCVSPELGPHNPRILIPGHAVSCDITSPIPSRIYSVYARNDSTSPHNAALREGDDRILYGDIMASPLPVFVAGDLNLILCYGDHHSHSKRAYDATRAPSDKVTRLRLLMDARGLCDAKPSNLCAHTYRSRFGCTSRLDYVLAETPPTEYMYADAGVDHSPVMCVYAPT